MGRRIPLNSVFSQSEIRLPVMLAKVLNEFSQRKKKNSHYKVISQAMLLVMVSKLLCFCSSLLKFHTWFPKSRNSLPTRVTCHPPSPTKLYSGIWGTRRASADGLSLENSNFPSPYLLGSCRTWIPLRDLIV